MRKIVALSVFCVAVVAAQTAETIPLRAVLLPANEVPPVTDLNAAGDAMVLVHVVKDTTGEITSGSVEFQVSFSFPGAVTLTGLHIHNGPAGTNAGVVFNTGVGPLDPVSEESGRGFVVRQAHVLPSDPAKVELLKALVRDPSQFYVNLHTPNYPAGAIRGQLRKAEVKVLMAVLSPANEVPQPPPVAASGVGAVYAFATRDASGDIDAGTVVFDLNYAFPEQVTFTGFHIHAGPAGVNGPVTIGTPIGSGAASVTSGPSGTGRLQYRVAVSAANQNALNTLRGLFVTPGNYYLNLHTPQFPAGVIRGQLRRTDHMRFSVWMSPANETPPITDLDAGAPCGISVYTLRYEDGEVRAGVVLFDVNYRFPGAADFTGMHIHEGAAGVAGPVKISSGLTAAESESSPGGFGSIYRATVVSDAAGVAALNGLTANPEAFYVNLHTRVNPGGAVRAQLAPANSAAPTVDAVVVAGQYQARNTVAPLGLISIYGKNLAKVTTNLDGWAGQHLPMSLNGVAVVLGGKFLPLLYVSPAQINAQAAADTPLGPQLLAVNNGNAPGNAVSVNVAAAAPNIFFYPDTGAGVVLKNADFTLVSPANPAAAGDIVLIYATGLGQTVPAVHTGMLVPDSPFSNTAPVTAVAGGQNAEVVYSIASPGFAGLYQVAVRIPGGLAPGDASLTIKMGEAESNAVTLAVR